MTVKGRKDWVVVGSMAQGGRGGAGNQAAFHGWGDKCQVKGGPGGSTLPGFDAWGSDEAQSTGPSALEEL